MAGLSSTVLSPAQTSDYADAFVSVSEIDGQFKTDRQTRFVFIAHTAVV